MQFLRRILLLSTLVLLGSATLFAQTIRQRSTTEGLSLGLQGHMLGWSSTYFQFLDENSGNGAGIGARLGYGLTQRFELFAEYDYTSMNVKNLDAESFRFSHVTGGLRFNFSATTHRVRPFAELGYALRTGQVNQVINGASYDNIIFKKGAFHVGGGLNYFVSLPVALTLSGAFQTGPKSTVTVNGFDSGDKADIGTFRISAGVILYLSEL
ncbi:MAG: porin family protein [Cytophagaceae bacterium]|nr:porin family protein [Cytophagaceae bacterium]